jgi:hypothetical protein
LVYRCHKAKSNNGLLKSLGKIWFQAQALGQPAAHPPRMGACSSAHFLTIFPISRSRAVAGAGPPKPNESTYFLHFFSPSCHVLPRDS